MDAIFSQNICYDVSNYIDHKRLSGVLNSLFPLNYV